MTTILHYLIGIAIGLGIAGIWWLIADRKAIKAELAAIKAKAEADVKTIQEMPKIAESDIKAVFAQFVADAKAEAAKTSATVTITPSATV